MAIKQIILEMGTGNDLHGQNYTKAAKRAVQDALHHSSLALFRSLGRSPSEMTIELTLATQKPDQVDVDAVAATLPYGTVKARAIKGGLDVPDPEHGDVAVIVNAGVRVFLDV